MATTGAGASDFVAVTEAVEVSPRKLVTCTVTMYTPPGSRSCTSSLSSESLAFIARMRAEAFETSFSDVTLNRYVSRRPPAPVDDDAVNIASSHAPTTFGPTRCASTRIGRSGGSRGTSP